MPNGLQKKLGPLKVWQWAMIGAALGVAVLIYKRSHPGSEETPPTGELFGGTGTGAYGPLDPETGIPYAFSGGGAAAGGATEDLFSTIEKLKELGFLEPAVETIETVVKEPPVEGQTGGEKTGSKTSAEKKKAQREKTRAAHKKAQEEKAKEAKEKRDNGKHPATSTGAGAAAGGAGHTSAPHPAQRIADNKPVSKPVGVAGNRPVNVKVKSGGAAAAPAPSPVTGGGGGVAQVGGAGGASGGVVHPAAFSSGIGAGHPKPPAPAGFHTYQGANGQWWFAPNN